MIAQEAATREGGQGAAPLACQDDRALVRAVRSGNDDAFGILYARHRPRVFRVLRSVLGAAGEVEDAAQETFLLAYRCLGDLRDSTSLGAWLRAIAVNVARKRRRQLALRQLRTVAPETLAALAGARVEHTPRRPPALPAVKELIRTLPAGERTVLALHFLLGLPQKATAEVLEIPLGTVKSRVNRARKALRRRAAMSQRIQSREEHPWREVISGMRGAIHWHSLLQGEGLAGWRTDHPQSWTRQGAVLMGSAGQDEGSRLIAGQADWQDYELSLLITPLSGGNAQVMFRCSEDGRQYYLFDMLLGWQALAISRGDLRPGGRLQKLSVVNFALELGQEYNVMIAARGRSLTTYVDGHPINQLTDDALPSGPMALNVWESKTAFHDPRIRLLS